MSVLNYHVYGDKMHPTLFIIHGLFGSLDNWMTLSKRWSKEYYVIAIDVRNHGRSFHSDDMHFEDMNDDINIILKMEEIAEICIMGHSMGGKIAMEFAAQYPEKVNKLIVVDVAPYAYHAHHGSVFEMLDQLSPENYHTRHEIENEIRRYIKVESTVQFMAKNIRRNPETLRFEWKFNYPVLRREYQYLIERIPKKGYAGSVLFIGGEKSDYITKETVGLVYELYPKFELEYVTNADHWVHADNPNEFFEKLNKFLKK